MEERSAMINALSLIDQDTVAIIPFFWGPYKSSIINKDGYYYTQFTAYELLDEKCVQFDSTLKGRQDAAARKLKIYKPPVIVEPKKIGFFPTISSSNPDCVWISQHPFTLTNENEKNKCVLHYTEDFEIPVNISKWTVSKQYERLKYLLGGS